MSNYINQDTNFNNIKIINDYPIITGGSWTAKLVNGKTVYVDANGTQSAYTGPVNFVGANLTIAADAVVDNVVVIGNSTNTNPTVTIQTKGTLSNSSMFTGTINVQPNGKSTGNDYVSSKVNIIASGTATSPGGISSKDSFYNIDSTSQTSGSLTTSSQDISFQTSDGLGKLNTGSIYVSVSDPFIKGPENGTGSTTLNIGQNSTFGTYDVFADRVNNNKAYYSNYAYTLENHYEIFSGGDWTASLVDGVTYYTKRGSNEKYKGPLNLYDITSLTITKGAVVDNLSVFYISDNTSPNIIINKGGELSNSLIGNSIITNYGTSFNNTYISPQYVGKAGAVSDADYFVQYGPTSMYTKLSQMTSLKGAMIGGVKSTVTLEQNTSFDSYIRNSYTGNIVFKISDTATIVCFLAGTMINTVNGLKAIEDIGVGEQVIIYNGGKQEVRSVIWTGYNTVKVKQHLSKDVAGYPVRILKDAISEGVPAKDLLITSEHCIFLNDSFIPVRMLVNGSSIFYDHTITEYTYYHIETEEHSIITADGVLTESYLDTGNRSSFISDDNITSIVNKNKKWNIDSAAPLTTKREVVEPIFVTLIERATKLGLELSDIDIQTTNDSQLHLLANSGEKLYPMSQNNGCFIFKLPEDITEVRLVSLTCRPSNVVGPYVDDRRNLGVLVGSITLIEKNKTVSITDHLTSTDLYGWDVIENGSCRWTNGNASLTIRSEISNNLGILLVEVIACGPYILTQDQQKRNIA